MLSVITYVETVKPGGWVGFDRVVNNNLDIAFGVDRHYYVARQQREVDDYYALKQSFVDVRCVRSIQEIKFDEPVTWVNIQPPRAFKHRFGNWLHDFEHPDNACYVFGPNHGEIELADGHNVSIMLEDSSLYSFTALSAVLYDRKAKFETGFSSRAS